MWTGFMGVSLRTNGLLYVNTMTNFRIPQITGNFLTDWAIYFLEEACALSS
jgi:hypothetical protein